MPNLNLFSNIVSNYNYFRQDYLGLSLPFYGLLLIFINSFIAISLILLLYLVGEKIKLLFFKKESGTIDIFAKIALGYIFFASGILILGMLGVFYHAVLYIYLVTLIIIAASPLLTLKKRSAAFAVILKEYRDQFSKYKWANIVILGFVLIGFLKLIPPETGVDALWYHTDYPRMYLKTHSMMSIDPRGKYYPGVTPTLSDMLYVVTESLSAKDSSRFVHFSFYLLVVLLYLVVFIKKYRFASLAALLFVTSPVIIRHTSTAYAEFQWVLCWLLAIFIVTYKRKQDFQSLTLSGVLFGGTLATKLWLLPFYAVFLIYIIISNVKYGKIRLLKLLAIFSFFSFLIPLLWYFRAFIITGNPLFPTFWNYPNGDPNSPFHFSFDPASLKSRALSLVGVSPLSLVGLVFILSKSTITKLIRLPYAIFAVIISITQFIIAYNWHRFIIPFYSIVVVILSIGIANFVYANKLFKYTFFSFCLVLFLYYFLNALLILPYGLGWADKNNYLTRVLSGNNSSYYDYGSRFSKLISKKDIVASYGLWGFYYADFNYIYAEEIFNKKGKTLDLLRTNGATKLLIKGGDIQWLCKTVPLDDCSEGKYALLANYTFSYLPASQYLYKL